MRALALAILLSAAAATPASASAEVARALNDAFVAVYEKVSPSVVVLEIAAEDPSKPSIFPPGWQNFLPRHPGNPTEARQGSGLILSADGYIATNYHVVASAEPGSITAVLKDGTRLPAKVVGADEKTDIAILQVEAEGLPAAELGDSDAVHVGQFAFAIGAPMELPYTLTFGIVSATGRSNLTRSTAYENYIQTDAAINPGNSGGPLCDIDGRVIGINTLISGLHRGLGFAIPINMVREIGAQLISDGEVVRPWLGISIEGIGENDRLRKMYSGVADGVVVQAILPGTPASSSQLRPGDVILKVDGRPVSRAGDVQKAVLARSVGDEVALEIWRRGKTQTLKIRTGKQPNAKASASAAPALQILPGTPEELPQKNPDDPAEKRGPNSPGLVVRELGAEDLRDLGIAGLEAGMLVVEVAEGSPADAAGLQVGDILTHIDQTPIAGESQFEAKLSEPSKSQQGRLLFLIREGRQTFAILKTDF